MAEIVNCSPMTLMPEIRPTDASTEFEGLFATSVAMLSDGLPFLDGESLLGPVHTNCLSAFAPSKSTEFPVPVCPFCWPQLRWLEKVGVTVIFTLAHLTFFPDITCEHALRAVDMHLSRSATGRPPTEWSCRVCRRNDGGSLMVARDGYLRCRSCCFLLSRAHPQAQMVEGTECVKCMHVFFIPVEQWERTAYICFACPPS